MSCLFTGCLVLFTACNDNDNDDNMLQSQVEVKANTLVSGGYPEGVIRMSPDLDYVGGETFILYDVARCEIHLYVEADESRLVRRLYWLQFEGYLPSVIPRTYDYSDDPYRTMIGGHEFYDSVRYFNITSSREGWSEDSDIMHMLRLLESNGYSFSDDIMRIRLVRLDENRKQELMIIYMEDLQSHGLDIDDFEGPTGESKWIEVSEGLRSRALAGMTLEMK